MLNELILEAAPGKPWPHGATIVPGGVQFSLVSRDATGVWLQLFHDSRDGKPYREFQFDPDSNRTGDVWHIEIRGLQAGALYLYRVDGPYDVAKGLRFTPRLSLIDPYALALTGDFRWDVQSQVAYDAAAPGKDAVPRRDTPGAAGIPKCIVVDEEFDWEGDRPLNYHLRDCVIYEAHVRGLSKHPSAEVEHPGTYRGVIEMIPYLQQLGVTSLELLPVMEFDKYELGRRNPKTKAELTNYWGYSTLAFFAPKASYAADGTRGEQVREFKEMVKELHRAGIEVILDIVLNHTGEGNEMGPTVSFRGIDNRTYYMLDDDKRRYRDFSGCGNTTNCNNPIMRTLITDCLRYWVVEMHVDGFRFDLGSILARDENGVLLENPPVLGRIAQDPVLRDTKIIAEAWDAGGAYQVGWFPGGRWAEWNDRFRDDVRRFWRSGGDVSALATRLSGSSDLYRAGGRKPFHSINFVTAHDGYTLRDLVSYERKHNEENGERNRDGHGTNYSCNYGVEGETDDIGINALRLRHQKNLIATLLMSLGTPMLLSGDEFGRTQRGNNNAYCHDTEVNWNDYSLLSTNSELHRFARALIALRKVHHAFRRPEFYTGRDNNGDRHADIEWFGPDGHQKRWENGNGLLGMFIDGEEAGVQGQRGDDNFYIVINATGDATEFVVPRLTGGRVWVRIVDTAAPAPRDVWTRDNAARDPQCGGILERTAISVAAHSFVVLQSSR